MPEPEHVVDFPELSAELDAILARFGAEAVVRVALGLAEEVGAASPFYVEPRDRPVQS